MIEISTHRTLESTVFRFYLCWLVHKMMLGDDGPWMYIEILFKYVRRVLPILHTPDVYQQMMGFKIYILFNMVVLGVNSFKFRVVNHEVNLNKVFPMTFQPVLTPIQVPLFSVFSFPKKNSRNMTSCPRHPGPPAEVRYLDPLKDIPKAPPQKIFVCLGFD